MKTIILSAVLVILMSGVSFAVDMSATGNEWKDYTQEEKVALVEAAYKKFGVTDNQFPPEVIAENMDTMYEYKAGHGMNTPCVQMIGAMIGKADKVGWKKGYGD
jgi:hypothetical protein